MPTVVLLVIIISEYVGLGSHYLPILKLIKFSLIGSFALFLYVMREYRLSELLSQPQAKIAIIFSFLTALSTLHGVVGSYAIEVLQQQIGYLILMIVCFFLIQTTKQVLWFCRIFTVSHLLIVLANLSMVLSSERMGHFKAGYFIGDGNDFAWSLNVAFPLGLFLLRAERSKWMRMLTLVVVITIFLGIIGTQSRGGTLALASGLAFYWFFMAKNKMKALIWGLMLASLAMVLAPSAYWERMESIGQYEEDNSATSRLHAWGKAFDMAVDHPLLGVGAGSFNSAYGRYYLEDDAEGWGARRWISTHSIYFKTLAEYGFPGLIFLLWWIWLNIRNCVRAARTGPIFAEGQTLSRFPYFLAMSQISYAVAGVFLGGINYPHLYLLSGLAMRCAAQSQAVGDTANQ